MQLRSRRGGCDIRSRFGAIVDALAVQIEIQTIRVQIRVRVVFYQTKGYKAKEKEVIFSVFRFCRVYFEGVQRTFELSKTFCLIKTAAVVEKARIQHRNLLSCDRRNKTAD